jgi:hypothetical protein
MGPSPFYKSHTEIYLQCFLTKVGYGLPAEQQQNRLLLKRVMLPESIVVILVYLSIVKDIYSIPKPGIPKDIYS